MIKRCTKRIPRPEHPRPDFMRDTYVSLNGVWQFAFDDNDVGICECWYEKCEEFDMRITVPFAYQTESSGIGPTDEIHRIMWYKRGFEVPNEMKGKRVFLHFGAVDFQSEIYINGKSVGKHKGGYTPFALDISSALLDGENEVCVRVEDGPDCTQPRGKQYWHRGVSGCWYTPVSGIWQSVYLDCTGDYCCRYIHITPDIDRHMVTAEIALDKAPEKEMTYEVTVSHQGEICKKLTVSCTTRIVRIPIDMTINGGFRAFKLWSPSDPALYDLEVSVIHNGKVEDKIRTYFGMRKIAVKKGKVYLNNCPLYQRLVLDQGYWPESLLTPPSDEAIVKDIELTLRLGYNGVRKHQKLEDPRYLYWADRMGLLVWDEIPAAYEYSDDTVVNLANTLMEAIDRDFNHPCVIVWTPINESWGVKQIYKNKRQQDTANMLYYMVKAADGTRLCSSNDGWEQTKTDICALHDYAAEKAEVLQHFQSFEEVIEHSWDWRPTYADGYSPTGDEAMMITEYGGIAFVNKSREMDGNDEEAWGYHGRVKDEEEFFRRFKGVTDAIREIPYCQGYCYTQLTDVMQEINGILDPNRTPKVDIEKFAQINGNPLGRSNQFDAG